MERRPRADRRRRHDAVHEDWSSFALHIRPAAAIGGANGKVRGVLTGLRFVTSDIVVIADDDVRYDEMSLEACASPSTTPTW